MLDPKLLRSEPTEIAEKLRGRGFELDIAKLESFETSRKDLQIRTQDLQSKRNSKSKNIGKAKAAGEDIQPLLDEVASLGDELKAAEHALSELQHEITAYSLGIPNVTHDTVPVGNDEEDNREERRWGEPGTFDFEPKDHVDLGEALGGIDAETAAKISGSRFMVLS
ncbi:MAG: serine--tRNA ligase, partial [Gammaproteobacteria bacterium]|nr:serine--tRNA ligase [Gammaproteobacteria bacterium]